MSYTLSFSHPHFPDGTEFNVGNLGMVPNGGSFEIDEEAERLYIMTHGVTIDDGFAGDATVSLTGSSALDPAEVSAIIESMNPPEVAPEVVPETAPEAAPTSSPMFEPPAPAPEGGGESA